MRPGADGELDPDRGRRETSDPAAPRRSDSTLRLTREASGPRRGAPARIPVVRPREAVGEGGGGRVDAAAGAGGCARGQGGGRGGGRVDAAAGAGGCARGQGGGRGGGRVDAAAGARWGGCARGQGGGRGGSGGRLLVGFVGGAIKQVWWRRGEPVYATSTAAEDGLLARLQARGLIGRGQAGLGAPRVDGGPAASARRLVQAGLLKPREQARRSATRAAHRRVAVLRRRSAGSSTPSRASATSAATRRARACWSGGAAGAQGRAAARGHARKYMSLRTGRRHRAAGRRSSTGRRRRSGSACSTAAAASGSLWRRTGSTSASCGRRRVLLGGRSGAAGGGRRDAALVAIDRRRIEERLALARVSDYFALLGVARDAGRAEVLRAHADLRETFAEERLEPRSARGAGG
jgi:hypothetical protein